MELFLFLKCECLGKEIGVGVCVISGVFNSSTYSANKNGFYASQREHLIVLNFCVVGLINTVSGSV